MIALHTSDIELVIKKHKVEIDLFISEAKANLIALLKRKGLLKREKKYLQRIIDNFDDIVLSSPDGFKKWKEDIGKIPPPPKLRKGVMNLSERIIHALGYKKLRTSFYPKYFQLIGINSCVYCNSQLTVAIDSKSKGKNVVKAKFQVDHYIPKSLYPFLSISLYNLYPVCASCNNVKGGKEVYFKLYSSNINDTKKSDFKFKLEDGCAAKFSKKKDIDEIKITFIEPTQSISFNDTFDILGIYNTQKDLVEELIHKSEIYTKSYKDNLIKSFPKIFSNESVTNRIIIGNYSFPNEIHNRPMSKFVQDIAEDLGLIPLNR